MKSSPTSEPTPRRFVIKGTPIVTGFAVGQVIYYRDIFTQELEIWRLKEDQVTAELDRLQNAMDQAHSDLSHIKTKVTSDMDASHAEIFGVHQMILKDMGLFKEIEIALKKRLINVEKIVQDVFSRWERKMRGAPGEIMPERASDIADVGRRLLRVLTGISENTLAKLPARSIVFAERLLPSDTVSLDEKNTIGLVTAEGTENSHSAILARALDIPFVSKIRMDVSSLTTGTEVIVDGDKGWIIVHPNKVEAKSYPLRISRRIKRRLQAVEQMKDIALTFEGNPIRILANVSSSSELKMAGQLRAEGIGLYRTEPFYMGKSNLPTEDELYKQMLQALSQVGNLEVTLRLLDIGGDKTLPFLDAVELKDPALGLNGVRLLLKHPELLKIQLHVFLRLSAKFNIRVLVPMVSLSRDMQEVSELLENEKAKLRTKGVSFNENLQLGAMIETPSALLAFNDILEYSHFISFGTNDLVQYVMAASREKISVADYYEEGNHLILTSLKEAIATATKKGKECSLCGELAGNLKFTQNLLHIGIRDFSVQPSLIPAIKRKILALIKSESSRRYKAEPLSRPLQIAGLAEDIVETLREPILVLGKDLRVIAANTSFYQAFEVSAAETMGKLVFELGNHQWDIPKLRTLLEKIIPKSKEFHNYEVDHVFDHIGHKIMLLNAKQIFRPEFDNQNLVLLAIEDITERRTLEVKLAQAAKKINTLAITDEMTQLYNRHGFIKLAHQQMNLALRLKQGMFLLFIDLNGLKAINDQQGHRKGDQAMMELAKILKETFRESDIVARFGGDEFIVLGFENAAWGSTHGSLRLLENLKNPAAQKKRGYKLAVSYGIAHYDPATPCSLDDLLIQADKKMYLDKQSNSKRVSPREVEEHLKENLI